MSLQLITSFRNYLQQAGYSKKTSTKLPACAGEFLSYSHTVSLEEITTEHVMEFYRWLQVRPNQRRSGGLSEVYIYEHIYALRVLFGWLEECGDILHNPMNTVLIKQPKSMERQPLSREEIKKLFDTCTSFKELVLLHLFYSCGLRREEAVLLDLRDVNLNQRLLYVRSGKGGKRRVVPLTEKVSGDMKNYILHEREVKNSNDTEAFMVNQAGRRMSGQNCIHLLKELLTRAEMKEQAYTLHHLRHSIATHLLENGLSMEEVREFLGHRHLESTQVYVKVSEKQLQTMTNE